MDIIINVFKVIMEEGLMYSVLALGVYITYSILDFPDLSVDGTMPFGAVLSAVLIMKGFNPTVALLVSFLGGALAGCVTGILHVKLKIRPLLCGILVMTALISVNLVIMMAGTGGLSVASFFRADTIFNSSVALLIPETISGYKFRVVIIGLVLAIVVKLLLDGYLKTKSGLLLRATGSNEQYVKMLARDPGNSKILGLAIGNGLAALSGSIIAQSKGSADLQMGTGMVVLGLASVIIGTSVFNKMKLMKPTTKVILGSLIYKACLSIALTMGLPTEYLKLLMAVLFTAALVASGTFKKGRSQRHA